MSPSQLPIGRDAVYEPARNSRPADPAAKYGYGIGDDHDLIVLTPDAPLTEVRHNTVGWGCTCSRSLCVFFRASKHINCLHVGHSTYWNATADRNIYNCTGSHSRCDTEGAVLFKVPMPRDFVVLADGGEPSRSRCEGCIVLKMAAICCWQATMAWPR